MVLELEGGGIVVGNKNTEEASLVLVSTWLSNALDEPRLILVLSYGNVVSSKTFLQSQHTRNYNQHLNIEKVIDFRLLHCCKR